MLQVLVYCLSQILHPSLLHSPGTEVFTDSSTVVAAETATIAAVGSLPISVHLFDDESNSSFFDVSTAGKQRNKSQYHNFLN